MTKILIADDHAICRRGVKQLLESEFEDFTCGEAEDGLQALKQIQAQSWDLLILDLSMRGHDGMELLSALRASETRLPVLVLTMHSEDVYAKRVLTAGARGYVLKESAAEELIRAVRKVLAGGRYVSPALAERLASELHDHGNVPSHDLLSDREFEILKMIAAGRTVSHIAEDLHLAVTTVSTYRARILDKMHKTNTAELIRYAIEHHLAD